MAQTVADRASIFRGLLSAVEECRARPWAAFFCGDPVLPLRGERLTAGGRKALLWRKFYLVPSARFRQADAPRAVDSFYSWQALAARWVAINVDLERDGGVDANQVDFDAPNPRFCARGIAPSWSKKQRTDTRGAQALLSSCTSRHWSRTAD